MGETTSGGSPGISRLILVPALITLGVTILRLVGELQHWSPRLFSTAPGGGGALVGISWLPLVFGPYFALKLVRAGEGPKGMGKAFGFLVLSLIIVSVGGMIAYSSKPNFPGKFLVGYAVMAAGAGPLLAGWPALAKTLIGYAYAARIPVAIVMFFAIRGNWGTHYDGMPRGYPANASVWQKFVEIGVLPQLVFWVVYTLVVGALLGTIVAAVARRGEPAPQSTS